MISHFVTCTIRIGALSLHANIVCTCRIETNTHEHERDAAIDISERGGEYWQEFSLDACNCGKRFRDTPCTHKTRGVARCNTTQTQMHDCDMCVFTSTIVILSTLALSLVIVIIPIQCVLVLLAVRRVVAPMRAEATPMSHTTFLR